MRDAEWIAQLLEHGLLRPSFVPPPPRRLRVLTRHREQLKGDRRGGAETRASVYARRLISSSQSACAVPPAARAPSSAHPESWRTKELASADLTGQESQIARLAAEGMTNPQIGARLFLSPRTVEWHLSHIYPKLGITSRRELSKGSISGATS